MKSIIISVVMLLAVVSPVFATKPENIKVNVCHQTGSESNPYVSVEVDKDAWDEHESAHSDHEGDFLITENTPCPPVEEEEQKDLCKNLEGIQTEVPEGYTVDGCDCIKDEVEEEEPPVVDDPEVVVATPSATTDEPEVEIQTLPATGNNLLNLAIFGLGLVVVGAGMKYLLRRK